MHYINLKVATILYHEYQYDSRSIATHFNRKLSPREKKLSTPNSEGTEPIPPNIKKKNSDNGSQTYDILGCT